MKALTMTEPSAYLAGVIRGDGWCTRELGLRVADEDFACAFASAIRVIAPALTTKPRLYRGYWDVRTSNRAGRWDYLRDIETRSNRARRAWLLGLFDSEGNASLRRLPSMGAQSRGRRVAFFSTNGDTLELAAAYLRAVDIPTRVQPWTNSKGHLGAKPVIALEVRGGIVNYQRFASLVGSNIERKQTVLDAIPLSYQAPGYHARAQTRGAASKRLKAETERLPSLLAAVRAITMSGVSPTYRVCMDLDGYWSARKTLGLKHSEIVEASSAL